MKRLVKQSRRKSRKLNKKSKTRKNYRKVKRGGMPPPIMDAAKYSYPPYFPNKGAEGKDTWPVKFQAPKVSDIATERFNQFPLGEDVIVDIQEQSGDSNIKLQAGGFVYDPRLMKKPRSMKNYKHVMFKRKVGK